MRKLCLSAAVLVLAIAPAVRASVIYSYWEGPGVADTVAVDDGQRADLWWANQFFTQPGGEAITSITLAFGPHVPLGTPISFMVYGDPDGNGLPNDLVWLAQVDTTVPAFNPPPGSVNSLMTVNFTAPVQVGLSFFIAALILDAPQVPCLPEDAPQTVCWTDIRAEITAPHGRSWIALNEAIPLLGSLNPMNPGGAELPPTNIDSLIAPAHLDWILTATADPGSATPEPSTAALVLGGLAVAGFIRRRARR